MPRLVGGGPQGGPRLGTQLPTIKKPARRPPRTRFAADHPILALERPSASRGGVRDRVAEAAFVVDQRFGGGGGVAEVRDAGDDDRVVPGVDPLLDGGHEPGGAAVEDGNPPRAGGAGRGRREPAGPAACEAGGEPRLALGQEVDGDVPAVATVGQLDEVRETLNDSSGGRVETDVRDVTVNPTGRSPEAAVTMETPAACRRNARRRSSSHTPTSPSPVARATSWSGDGNGGHRRLRPCRRRRLPAGVCVGGSSPVAVVMSAPAARTSSWTSLSATASPLRQILSRLGGGRSHFTLVGTPDQVADKIESWFRGGAAAGFNVMAPVLPAGLQDFADHVLPLLRRGGLRRDDAREHYGLGRPPNRYDAEPAPAEREPAAV
jgi:hypothetical protein